MTEIKVESVIKLIRLAATDLPEDVETALKNAADKEENPPAQFALRNILKNVSLAREKSISMCQDTGTPIFYIDHPIGLSQIEIRSVVEAGLKEATKKGYLRPNAVNSITGENSGNNIGGAYYPLLHFNQWNKKDIEITLLLKGGGSENVGAQYSLPDMKLNAGRDLDGVQRVVLDAVQNAQGKGCPPSIVGVGIGGDRAVSYLISKQALLRRLDESNPDPMLDDLETSLLEKINRLGIGPMGFGGRTTALGVKVEAAYRLPASYFVSISMMCWACRRWRLTIKDGVEVFSS